MSFQHLRQTMFAFIVITILGLVLTISQTAQAQTEPTLAPTEIPGEVVYVPFPVKISVDGKLDDWAGVPVQTVTKGPYTSADPAENGSFTFSVAADAENFYLTMVSIDKTIITGKHDANYWNEDSLEFYLNVSGNLSASTFDNKVMQFNINPGDIGKTDPTALTLTGSNSGKVKINGLLFKTKDGWGFEAAIPLEGLMEPKHGAAFGFQAQTNGATKLDRDVKLIWSNADTADQSWQNPSLFGEAIFFEVGSSDIPAQQTRPPTATPTPTPKPVARISVNQTGYFPNAPKHAVIVSDSRTPLDWQLTDSAGKPLLAGASIVFGGDEASGENVHQIDFSAFTTPGKGYILQSGEVKSYPFDISANTYATLKKDALSYFYLNRSGMPIEPQYSPGHAWARPAGHLTDKAVTCYKGVDNSGKEWPGCDYTLDASGGWYDAGDYGKYVVNGGIAVWTLMNIHERNPEIFRDGTMILPKNDHSLPDILDEARWEMNFILGMQVPAGQPLAGMAHHKLHGKEWDAMPSIPPAEATRFVFPPSTAATLNLAATAAQCARIWKTYDKDFSARCLTAAETAWEAARANPNMLAVSFSAGGGDYGDNDVTDDFYWAAAELYITTGKDVYKDYLLSSRHFGDAKGISWGTTNALGTISLAIVPNSLPADKIEQCRQGIITLADTDLQILKKQGYAVPIEPARYFWGSNSEVLNQMLMMGLAYDFTKNQAYLDGMVESMDYLLGRNPLNKSYVAGYGSNPLQHPHHRFWMNRPEDGYPPPPPGTIAGGPNGSPSDGAATAAGLTGKPPAKSYVDNEGSYSTNEVAINWNAPLVWGAAYLDQVGSVVYTAPETKPQAATATPAPAPTATPPAASTTPNNANTPSLWIGLIVLLLVIAGGVVIWLRQRRS